MKDRKHLGVDFIQIWCSADENESVEMLLSMKPMWVKAVEVQMPDDLCKSLFLTEMLVSFSSLFVCLRVLPCPDYRLDFPVELPNDANPSCSPSLEPIGFILRNMIVKMQVSNVRLNGR